MRTAQTVVVVCGVVLAALSTPAAQQPGQLVQLGGLRVPACPTDPDPQFGFVKEKPIPIGGGPGYMMARKQRYVAALRGPQGQVVRMEGGIGTSMVKTDTELTFIDSHTLVYDGPDGPVKTTLFMDAYHFETPKAPAGFTCGAPLPSSVGVPPVDPFKATPSIVALAIERGTKDAVAPVRLDPAVHRGYLLERYAVVALRARAAAEAGRPLDPENPPKGIDPPSSAVVAYPITCGDRTVKPQDIELTGPQGPIAREPGAVLLRDEALAQAFPGMAIPEGAIGMWFRPAQPTQSKITYAEACEGGSVDVTLPFRATPPKLLQSAPAVLPAGTSEIDPTIYIQAVIDVEGRFARPQYLGGPRSLLPAALTSIEQWRAEPARVNGVPIVNPIVLQVPFRQ